MSIRRRYALAGAILLAAFAGCTKPEEGGGPAGTTGASGGERGQITIKGSDTMVQLAQAWAQEFMKTHPNIRVTVTGGGSNTGIVALINKGTDVANASRPMKEEEKRSAASRGVDVKEFVVAQDALSVIVHPSNPINELTMEQLKDIYTGRVTNWKELGGPDQTIVLNSRESSSGTYVFFQEHVLGKGVPYAKKAMLQPSTSAIVQNVAQDKGGIGYVGLGYVNETVKSVKMKKDAASSAVAANVEDVLNGTYPLARPLYQYSAGEPTGAVKTWIDWVQGSEGQAVVQKLDFVPIK
jgi:phosphate transport system substrate-binding protein